MNLLQIILLTVRLWRSQLPWYALAGLTLFFSMLIGSGIFSGTLIADGALALSFGPAGTWINQPLVLLAILLTTAVGFLAASYLLSAGIGAFLHSCAQIGAGHREINLVGYVEYAVGQGPRFWLIALLVASLMALLSVPVALLGLLLSAYWAPAFPIALALAIAIALLVALPFWLSFPAQVVRHAGVMPSLLGSLKASIRSPIASLLLLLLLLFFFFAPMVFLVFYPVYFFFFFAPLAGTLMLVYYEAVLGLIKE